MTWFSSGWQGCSSGFPMGFALWKSLRAAPPALGKPRPSLLFYLDLPNLVQGCLFRAAKKTNWLMAHVLLNLAILSSMLHHFPFSSFKLSLSSFFPLHFPDLHYTGCICIRNHCLLFQITDTIIFLDHLCFLVYCLKSWCAPKL